MTTDKDSSTSSSRMFNLSDNFAAKEFLWLLLQHCSLKHIHYIIFFLFYCFSKSSILLLCREIRVLRIQASTQSRVGFYSNIVTLSTFVISVFVIATHLLILVYDPTSADFLNEVAWNLDFLIIVICAIDDYYSRFWFCLFSGVY